MGNHKAGVLAAITASDRRIGLAARFRREPLERLWLSQWVPARRRARGRPRPRGRGGPHRIGPLPGLRRREDPGRGRGRPRAPRPATSSSTPAPPGAASGTRPSGGGGSRRRSDARPAGAFWSRSGPAREGSPQQVEQASGGAAVRAEASDLPRLVGLLAGAALVLGGDTGPLHLAHALGVPTLFLHGPTDPRTHGPYGAPERALRRRRGPGSGGTGRGDRAGRGSTSRRAWWSSGLSSCVDRPRRSARRPSSV